MGFLKCRRICRYALHAALALSITAPAIGQATKHYDASISSLDQHPLPQWFDDAKLGIFVHWGLYSVPGWAPLELVNFEKPDFLKYNPYAEWYYNTVRIDGSPTQAYNNE